MSNVIEFTRENRNRSLPTAGEPTGQILLFTGIRYIRDDDEPADEAVAVLDARAPQPTPREATGERLQA